MSGRGRILRALANGPQLPCSNTFLKSFISHPCVLMVRLLPTAGNVAITHSLSLSSAGRKHASAFRITSVSSLARMHRIRRQGEADEAIKLHTWD